MTINKLRQVVNTVTKFTNMNECIQFITGIEAEKTFVIASGSLGQDLVPNIHNLSQVDAIYIFCANPSRHEQWTKEWIKIKGIHTDIKPICHALQQAAKQCNKDSIAVSFVPVSEGASTQKLDQLEPSFMYTQIFKEILLEMEHDEKSIKDLAIYCRQFYNDNMHELNIICKFEHNYQSKSPICYGNIGGVYKNMGEYSKALSFYEKALEIDQKTLSANHPSLANSYNNIGVVYKNMGEYSKALSFYEKALDIDQKTLPPNHPHLATSYNNIGGVYYHMGECSKALSYFERALDINQRTLPPNQPSIQNVLEWIEIVKEKL